MVDTEHCGYLSWSNQFITLNQCTRTCVIQSRPVPSPAHAHYLHPTRLILWPLHGNLISHCPAVLDHVTHYCMITLGHVTFYCEVTGSHVCGPFPDGFKPYPVYCRVSSLVYRTVTLVTSRSLSSHLNQAKLNYTINHHGYLIILSKQCTMNPLQ